MRLVVILVLIAAVISAVVLVQTGTDFTSNAMVRVKKPLPLPKTCSTDSDCKITTICPPKTKCIRFFDNEVKFSCQNGKCVAKFVE